MGLHQQQHPATTPIAHLQPLHYYPYFELLHWQQQFQAMKLPVRHQRHRLAVVRYLRSLATRLLPRALVY